MNFRQLETFYWIAKLGTFAAAADKLNATQSTISARVSQLESSLQVTLFDRSGRTAKLTSRGWALLGYAESALTLRNALYRDVCGTESVAGRVRLGVGEIVALSWLPDLLRALAARHPRLEVEVFVDLTVNLHVMLETGRIDLAFGVARHPSLVVTSSFLGRVAMRWAASPGLGLGGRALSHADLEPYPIYSLSKNSHLHSHFLSWLQTHHMLRPQIHVCNSITTMIALARTGSGVAVLPEILIADELQGGRLELLDAPQPIDHYDFFVAYETGTPDGAVLATARAAMESTTFSHTDLKP